MPGAIPPTAAAAIAARPPTREELQTKLGETQDRITELKRRQDDLEKERVALEEARRRRQEFETGRAEVLDQLIRGVGLLEKAEFDARRDAEQMAKTLADFRVMLGQVKAIHEETWTQDNWQSELTRALTTVENARMEWNAARLKWTLLDAESATATRAAGETGASPERWLAQHGFWGMCRLGLALTWPLILAILVASGVLAALLGRR